MTLLIAFFLLSIAFSFLCSIWEAVLLSVTPTYINRLKSENHSMAPVLERFKADIDRPLSAILTLNTIAHTVGAIGVGVQATMVFGNTQFALGPVSLTVESLVAALMTLAILIFSEIIPKTIGANNWKVLAPLTARCLKLLLWILAPFVFLSQLITRALKKNKDESVLSRLDLQAMVDSVEKSGELRGSESRIINNLLGFEKLVAEDIMTPRNVTVMADETQTTRAFYDAQKAALTFSRIPLYGKTRDQISGVLLKDELLQRLVEGQEDLPLSELSRPVEMVSDKATLPVLFRQMVQANRHMSIVVDQYGVVRGIVTMEDLIETLFGQEIVDEMDSISDLQAYARRKWRERAEKLGIGLLPDEEELTPKHGTTSPGAGGADNETSPDRNDESENQKDESSDEAIDKPSDKPVHKP